MIVSANISVQFDTCDCLYDFGVSRVSVDEELVVIGSDEVII
jgi:hypothetical protein